MATDFYRDTWVRYLGYANEIGESFRSVVPRRVVKWSYQIAFTYNDGSKKQVLVAAGDALIWQTLASVVIPGFTINRICTYTHYALGKYASKVPPNVRTMMTVGAGLASIPIIVRPIDAGVNVLMDITYRVIF
ncbi:Mitochondrial 18 kDa protein [Operophtera brumata]|uniref:Mitochondrial fission process protein 1 n=1 Tax=Operophtera brumata TaxID=104452 RepID=A0A0L7L889_OPEBR|nr:Mitochondrial 18 kDa protein [Operophtera brumata]